MTGVSSALCGTPLAARTRPTASLRSSTARRVENNNCRRVVRCAVQEPEEDIVSRAARGCDPSNEEECIITPRQVVNGLELPSFEDVSTAHFRIRSGVVRTRCTHSRTLSALTGMKIYLKHEWEQATGSFKERGARNSLLALEPEQKKKGVVAASAGNHALALAYHGRELGIPVTVLMPSIAPLTKITKCRALEANVVLEGDTIADAAMAARSYVERDGMKYINGFDDFNIIAGAGSVGLEILEDAKDIDAIVVPVGGGGLIAGIALAVKTINPKVQIIGVEPDRCPSMAAAMAAGKVVKVPTAPTLADGLAVPTVGPRSFEVLRPRVDKLVTVSEKDISVSLLRLVETEKLVQEGAGAAGIAACLAGKLPELEGKNVAVLLCGGNIDTSTLGNVLERGLVNDGRLIRFSAVVPDRPGGIAGLCAVIAFVGASIKQIVHERAWLQEDSHAVQVDVTCELTGDEMKEALYKALSEKYAVDFSLSKSKLNMSMVGKDSAGMMAAESTNGATAKTYSFDKNNNGAKPGRLPAPVLYDYDTIINNVKPSAELVAAVEDAFSQLANGRVDVPLPMHIGIAETPEAGPGDCHIKGGYIEGAPTWTVKLANVSFYNNVKKGLPAGSGVFVVCDATNGGPKAVLHENRYLTDLRTGSAGAVCVKHLAPKAKSVAFIGTGVIAEAMARATATVHGFEEAFAFARSPQKSSTFCKKMSKELGYPFYACATAEDAVRNADVVFTQTPGGEWVLEEEWLRPHATIIASGSDQPTKNELPPSVMAKAKFVTDITGQCSRVGELRSAIEAGLMTADDVHAEIGQIINGEKPGRVGNELIVCDLTGTGAQDAAIGSYVMKALDGVVPGAMPPVFDANKPRLPAPKLYDYDTIKSSVAPSLELTESVEDAFSQLANGRVDVPLPMHIGIAETPEAGPGDCHIKGGYIEGAPTWTVKLANVSFYNNVKKGLPAGSGVFVVCDATNGGPKAVLHENRYLTDLRTGAAGAVAVKHLAIKDAKSVAFIGTGVIAEAMARSSATVHGFEQGYGYSRDMTKNSAFCDKMSAELGYAFTPCSSAEEAVRNADVVFTQTPGGEWVLDLKWLKPHALIVASGSDQPTKNEIPPAVMKKARVVTDITAQCLRVGELRSAVEAGVMKETDVHAQLGEVINGTKKGRTGKELIVCDLTGTGAQDAAIGSYVMKVLD